jgi:hypothetical protein
MIEEKVRAHYFAQPETSEDEEEAAAAEADDKKSKDE